MSIHAGRPTREENLMEMAHVAAERSTCSRAHVGCVFARDGRVLVTGYNGAPAGMPHCDHHCSCGVTQMSIKRTHDLTCKSSEPCTIAVHAEANAIAFAAKHGVGLEGSELFATFSPCVSCAQLLVNVGITKLHSAAMYRVKEGVDLLVSAGIQVVDCSNSPVIR